MAENLIVKIIGDASKLTSELEKAGGNVKSFSEKVGSIGKVMTIVGGVITGAFALIIKKTVDAGDAFNDMSLRTGIAVETLSALDYAGKQTGTAIEAIELSLKFLTKVMDDTSKGIGTAKDTFAALGIAVTDTNGKLRPTVEVMKDIATKVAAIDDPAKQAAIAMELFGARSGTQLLPLLKLGAGGIDELMKKAQELGIVMSTESAQAADEFKDRMYDLKESLGAVGRDIANVLIPPLLDFTNKAIEIVKRIREWADAHKPLIEMLIKITAGLGVFCAVGGPILMTVAALAKLKTAFTVLGMVGSGPIGIFIVAIAAIAAGIILLNERLQTAETRLSDFRVEVNKMSLAELDTEIQTTTELLDKMQQGLSEGVKPGIEYDELLKAFETEREKLEVLQKKREELTTAEKEGIETTKIAIPLTKEQSDAIEKLADVNKTLGDDIYRLSHTEYEYFIKKLYEQAQASIDAGASIDEVTKWVELQTEAYIKLNPQIETSITDIRVWAQTYAQSFEKADTQIIKFNETIKASIDGIRVWSPTYAQAFEKADMQIIKFGESAKTAWDKWKVFFDNMKTNLGTTVTILQDGIAKFVNAFSTGLTTALNSLFTMKATNAKIKEEMAAENATFLTDEASAQAIYDAAVIAGDDVKTAEALVNLEEIRQKHEDTLSDMEGKLVTAKSIWQTFWSDLKTTALQVLAEIIVKQALLALLSMGWVGWLILGVAAIYAIFSAGAKSIGGEVKNIGKALGGAVRGFASGGNTDIVPAMLTPGEYVIAKPMTDFIKKFKMIPANLVGAISMGMPTPAPVFAGGGSIGDFSGSRTGYGYTNINVDIHDNKISDDVDIKRLASTVSDEILRKINMNRRH